MTRTGTRASPPPAGASSCGPRIRASGPREDALSWLCEHYWFPLYAYVRRRIADAHEAQDLTQQFFARLLEKNVLDHAAPDRGRFRSFLLASLKNFLANERDRARAGSGAATGRDLRSISSRASRVWPSNRLTRSRPNDSSNASGP